MTEVNLVKCWACKKYLEFPRGVDATDMLVKHLDTEHPGWPGFIFEDNADAGSAETESSSPASA